MQSATQRDSEKAALEALFASGIFDRSPSLGRLMQYVCQRYFEGESDRIKEYNIAVDALGRPANFDQKTDSIVRVEAHRLRKRLNQFYASEGSSLPVHILIPEGRYVPVFLHRGAQISGGSEAEREAADPPVSSEVAGIPAEALPIQTAVGPAPLLPAAISTRGVKKAAFYWIGAACCVGLLAAAPLVWKFTGSAKDPAPGQRPPAPPSEHAASAAGTDEIRILAGRPQGRFADRLLQIWNGDQFFSGGTAVATPHRPVSGLNDQTYFASRREGEFEYKIPLGSGVYEMRLIFAETLYGEGNSAGGGESTRVFHVYANGALLLQNFDVISDAFGSNVADIKVFKDISPDRDGFLKLRFVSTHSHEAFLNAIEILPAQPRRIRPIRLVARPQPYRDPQGQLWLPDVYVTGGNSVIRPDVAVGASDPELYRGERFGHFRYAIPVAPGKYAVTLHFMETWFGEGMPGGAGPGARRFDVFANHQPLLKGFDLLKESGGPDRPLKRTFHGLEPDAQGKLQLSFVPVENYALINAIEVIDETP